MINIKGTLLFLLPAVFMLVLVACEGPGSALEKRMFGPPTATPDIEMVEATSRGSELDSAMKEELLALANNRDAWFLASDITTEALQGLYGSSSLICLSETSLIDYEGAVYERVRPLNLKSLAIDLKDAQKAHRYYDVVFWSSPWAYVEQTWKLGDEIVLGPERQVYVLESGAWRYHDC